MGFASPPLLNIIDGLADKDLKILIPGAGNAYEAEYLLRKGFTNITVADISGVVIEILQQRFKDNPSLHLKHIDFFELDENFDVILEQTFFCALDPAYREQYVSKMAQLLNSGGKLSGVLFNRNFEEGPPFGGSRNEYLKLFIASFNVVQFEPCVNSIEPRAGSELQFSCVV